MLKKILAACAGVLVSGGMTLAENVSGVFSGQADGQPIAITLHSDGENVRGSVSFNGSTLPLVGRENNGQIQGIWRSATGQNFPFAAATDGSSLQLQTNGATYSLNRGRTETPARVVEPERHHVEEDQNGTQEIIRREKQATTRTPMTRGQIFAFPLPQGWNSEEGTNAIFVSPPDSTMMIGFTGLERFNTGTPIQFLHYMMDKVHNQPISEMISCDRVACKDGGEAIEAVWVTNRPNGLSAKTWARVTIMQGYGSSGYVLFASAAPEIFDRVIGNLKAMAEKIQVINPAQAFQRDTALAAQQGANYNHPMDHSFADGYWARQKTIDGVMSRGSDVRRDSYISTDPHTGTGYWHDGSAYDNNGRVVNPVRPDEYLDEAPHWQNQ